MIKLLYFFVFTVIQNSIPINGDRYDSDQPVLIQVNPEVRADDYRLPTTVIPSKYDIELTPYFEAEDIKQQFTFDGRVEITLRTTLSTVTTITLHMNKLNIDQPATELREVIFPTTIATTAQYDPITHFYHLNLTSALRPNIDYVLTFKYIGELGADMSGFYRSSYQDGGTTKWVGTTQMQPTYARQVFPCFDEPSFKAVFVVKINRKNNFHVVSNTRLERTEDNTGPQRSRDIFKPTPKMSTYLLAFIVSEFRLRENVLKTFGVLARPDAYSQTEYSFDIGQRTLTALELWTDYRYYSVPEIEKMHMAALPDFAAGAMENWGLLTYRETALLYDSDVSTAIAQQRVASVITHEQAHMWFGDLVTCEWWSYTWLNEGFARFFQYFGTALVENTWDLDLQFTVEQLQAVFNMDALETTHPMTHPVNTPAEIDGIFDSISYNKGAAVIRMIQHLMGETNFQAGVREYLKTNQFTAVAPERLYSALQRHMTAAETIQIAALMNTWTTQSGYPLLTVQVHEDDRREVTISQSRFLLRNRTHTDQTKWTIPLSYASPSRNGNFDNTQTFTYLEQSETAKNITLQNATDWVIFNVQQTGYYRVNYDTATWNNIARALHATRHSGIHVLNRAQIVDDILNLARSGHVTYELAFSTIQFLEHEEHYLPWLSAFNNFAYIWRRLQLSDWPKARAYMLGLMDNIYNQLGFEGKASDTRLDIYNRENVLRYACKYGHTECVNKAREEFSKLETVNYNVPVNVRSTVYCTAVSQGGRDEWVFLRSRFETENVAAERDLILRSLGCTTDPAIVREYVDYIISDKVRLQDKATAFTALYNEYPENIQPVLDYVLQKYREIVTAYENNYGSFASICSGLAARFRNQAQISQLEQFYEQNKADFEPSRTIPNAIVEARLDLQWSESNIPSILEEIASSALAIQASLLVAVLTVLNYYLI